VPPEVPLVLYRDANFPGGLELGISAGVSAADLDGDGWVDLFLNSNGNLWRNVNGQTWQLARNLNGGLLRLEYGSSCADFDGDGDNDIATEPRTFSCFRLFRNDGFTFFDMAEDPSLLPRRPCRDGSETAGWADVDFDGWLDLFLPTYQPSISGGDQDNYFWRNLGPASVMSSVRFVEISRAANLAIPPGNSRPEGAQFCDYDFDGDVDLFSNGALYQNRSTGGTPSFAPMDESGSGIAFPSFLDEGAAFFDYDLDGDYDLAVSYVSGPGVTMWENRGDGTFFRAEDALFEGPRFGFDFGLSAADWDNDGDLDLTTRFLFRQNRILDANERRFVVAEADIPFGHIELPAIAWFDYDRDGDLDCAISNVPATVIPGNSHLYVNTTYTPSTPTPRRHVRVRPVTDAGNAPDGLETEFGASATLTVADAGAPRHRRFTASGSGYLNQNEYALHFAVPAGTPPVAGSAAGAGGAADLLALARALGAEPLDETATLTSATTLGQAEDNFALDVEFVSDPSAGRWRVDRHVNPVLGAVDLSQLQDREIIVWRSGRVRSNGCEIAPVPQESPRMLTTAGGLSLPSPSSGLPPLEIADPDTFIGVDLSTTAHVRLVELRVDGDLAAADPFNVAVWDVTTPSSPSLVDSSSRRTSLRNRRSDLPVEIVLAPGRRYRIVAAVTTLRATQIPGPVAQDGVTTHGGLRFVDPDPGSGAQVASAAPDPTRLYLAASYRRALVATPIDLGGGVRRDDGTLARLALSGTFVGGTPVQFALTGAARNSLAVLVLGAGVATTPFAGACALTPLPSFVLPGPLPTDSLGSLTISAPWPTGLRTGSEFWFQAWFLDGAAVAASNVAGVRAP
jgi:hypothetical protein